MAQQIKKKFIGNDQVGASKILIESGSALRAMDGASEVELAKVSSGEVFLNGTKILNSSNLVPSSVLPSYVDDVIEVANFAALPVTGESGKIYITLDTNKQYRWSGSVYVQITSGAVDSVNGETGVVVLDASEIQMVSEAVSIESKLVSLQGEIDAEELARANADTTLQNNIDTLETNLGLAIDNVQAELDATQAGAGLEADGSYSVTDNGMSSFIAGTTTLKGSIDALDLALIQYDLNLGQEILDRTNGDAALQTELDATQVGAGLGTDGSYTAPVGSNYLGLATSLKDGDSKLDAQIKVVADDLAQEILDRAADVDAEETRALAAEGVLQGNIDTVASNLAQEILDRAADVDAEETRALAAESALDVRVSSLEAVAWYNEKFVVDATILSNGFVTLSHSPKSGSIVANVDRLSIFEGAAEDFTIAGSVMTFLNQLVSPGQQALQVGDEIRVKYQA